MTIYPTGTCFTDALEYLAALVSQNPRLARGRRVLLVHGIARLPAEQPGSGELFAHAWIEREGWCQTIGVLNGERVAVRRDHAEFYRQLRVRHATSYTVRQAWRENRRTGMYGPWKPGYLALCRDRQPSADAVGQRGEDPYLSTRERSSRG